jgi:hypothetical protein
MGGRASRAGVGGSVLTIEPTVLLTAVLSPLIGAVIFLSLAVVKGWLVPKASHERELSVLRESHAAAQKAERESNARVVDVLESRLTDKTDETDIWRKVATTEQASTVELLAQHRMSLETNRASVYAIEGFRDGLVRAQKEADNGA